MTLSVRVCDVAGVNGVTPGAVTPGGAVMGDRVLWARHDMREHSTGVKRINHPAVSRLDLRYAVLQLTADPGLTLAVYTAEPGSRSADGLNLLASWAASEQHDSTVARVRRGLPTPPRSEAGYHAGWRRARLRLGRVGGISASDFGCRDRLECTAEA